MPRYLSQQQVEQFHEQGFVSPVDVMSEHEADRLRERLEEMEHRFPEQVHAENRNNVHLVLTCLDEICHHPVILDAVQDLIGDTFALWATVLFIKEPESRGYVSWHQDATYMGVAPHEFVSPWLALTPSNRDNGCMSMIPGSHKLSIQTHEDTFDEDNILTRGQVIREVDEQAAVDLVLQPGQMSIHHARTIHGSRPNRSDRRRIGFTMQSYCAAGSRQTVGKNYWMPIRGEWKGEQHVLLERPATDVDERGVENRRKVDENLSEILYHGAREKRRY